MSRDVRTDLYIYTTGYRKLKIGKKNRLPFVTSLQAWLTTEYEIHNTLHCVSVRTTYLCLIASMQWIAAVMKGHSYRYQRRRRHKNVSLNFKYRCQQQALFIKVKTELASQGTTAARNKCRALRSNTSHIMSYKNSLLAWIQDYRLQY